MAQISFALLGAHNVGVLIETLAKKITISKECVREHIDTARQLLATADSTRNDWASQS
jgi:hypothetical protein